MGRAANKISAGVQPPSTFSCPMSNTAILLVSCPDRIGLVAHISNFIFHAGGNILNFAQHSDTDEHMFLARVEWDLSGFKIERGQIPNAFQPLATEYCMQFSIHFGDAVPRVAVFASKLRHCLEDLLLRHRSGEFQAEIALVIGNHQETEEIAGSFDIPFRYFPITPTNKIDQERLELCELRARGVELIVLARYMQVLSEGFAALFPNRIINIHHSFLPAFSGAHPYQRAYSRGVKLIGATSHYVTMEVDEGPIIEQEVVRVTHRDSVADLVRKGRDLEKVVLARAVRLHLERRILTYDGRTVVFD
jgi:formyltetrahydrofolate deformylase